MRIVLLYFVFLNLGLLCADTNKVLAQIDMNPHSSQLLNHLDEMIAPGANIVGLVWDDVNADGRLQPGENLQRGVTVYLDSNDNGRQDDEETSTVTNAIGVYVFSNLPKGEYVVRQEVPFGWRNISGGDGQPLKTIDVVRPTKDDLTTQIIGGRYADEEKYPFMVSVGTTVTTTTTGEVRYNHFCGGSLVADRWVVTAAHCTPLPSENSEATVVLGTNLIGSDRGVSVPVSEIKSHPLWQVPFGTRGHDIAVWELASPVRLGKGFLETISMLTSDDLLSMDHGGVLGTTIGWGSSDLLDDWRLLKEVHVPILEPEVCREQWAQVGQEIIKLETMVCTSIPEGGIGTCNGDSGGPLMVRDLFSEQWRLAGAVSWGDCSGFSGNIYARGSVFARVSNLSEWIMQNAREPSRVHRIDLNTQPLAIASFGNKSTRYEPNRPIEPRWQLSGLSIDDNEAKWRVIDEAEEARVIGCTFGYGNGTSIDDIPCGRDTPNSAKIDPPGDIGIYVPRLSAQLGEISFTRTSTTPIIVGPLPAFSVEGELTTDDPLDPSSFPYSYRIDYYTVSGISYEKPIMVEVESEDVSPAVFVYDADVRRESGRDGYESFIRFTEENPTSSIIFIPSSDVKEYLIGVSSFANGPYTLTIRNEGTLAPTSLMLSDER